MTPAEMLDTVKEYQTTDSISRKNALFDLIRQRTWEVWFMSYQCARKLYLDYPLPEVAKILNWWGPIEKDLEKYVDGHSYYTQIDIHSPIYHHPIWDDKIILSGISKESALGMHIKRARHSSTSIISDLTWHDKLENICLKKI